MPRLLPLVLAVAILGLSVSGPLAKLSSADALAVATWRLAIALTVIAGLLGATGAWREYRTLARRDLAIAVGAGAMLAIHLWSWITSLSYTTVAASIVLVNLHPIVMVTGSALFLHERPSRQQLAGLAVAMVGAAIVAFGDVGTVAGALSTSSGTSGGASGRSALFGDFLAFVGAVTVGVYYLVGRSLRQRLSLWPYVGLVYGACLAVLLVLAALSGARLWPQPAREWWIFAGIAAGPMLLGHTGFNWALKYIPAYLVSLAILVEPLGATILAAVLPGIAETPGMWTIVGGAVALGGLALGTLAARAGGKMEDGR